MFGKSKKSVSATEPVNKEDQSVYSQGAFIDEALEFLKDHINQDTFDLVMSRQQDKAIPSVLARLYLSESDWQKYIWIEKYGNLKDYQG